MGIILWPVCGLMAYTIFQGISASLYFTLSQGSVYEHEVDTTIHNPPVASLVTSGRTFIDLVFSRLISQMISDREDVTQSTDGHMFRTPQRSLFPVPSLTQLTIQQVNPSLRSMCRCVELTFIIIPNFHLREKYLKKNTTDAHASCRRKPNPSIVRHVTRNHSQSTRHTLSRQNSEKKTVFVTGKMQNAKQGSV